MTSPARSTSNGDDMLEQSPAISPATSDTSRLFFLDDLQDAGLYPILLHVSFSLQVYFVSKYMCVAGNPPSEAEMRRKSLCIVGILIAQAISVK